jgi:nucleoside-diphosphate-sugar epimerase
VAETVLVTGGTGFVGGWCIVELLRRGYDGGTTVRRSASEPAARDAVSIEVDAGDGLRFFVADLTAERVLGWRSRPAAETIVDCAKSLTAHGAV